MRLNGVMGKGDNCSREKCDHSKNETTNLFESIFDINTGIQQS